MLQCGVDNLQTYPAILRDVDTGQEYAYSVINIIGKIKKENIQKYTGINFTAKLPAIL